MAEQQIVAKIFVKQSGYQIPKAFRIYDTGRSIFLIRGLVFWFKAIWGAIEIKNSLDPF